MRTGHLSLHSTLRQFVHLAVERRLVLASMPGVRLLGF